MSVELQQYTACGFRDTPCQVQTNPMQGQPYVMCRRTW